MFKKALLLVTTSLILTGCYHTGVKPAANPTPRPEADQPVAETPAVTETSVEIKNFAFNPATITVKPGAKITITNQDGVGHTLTSDDGQSFDTGMLNQGQSATITAPTQPGSYPFHCTPHPYMKGTLVVKE